MPFIIQLQLSLETERVGKVQKGVDPRCGMYFPSGEMRRVEIPGMQIGFTSAASLTKAARSVIPNFHVGESSEGPNSEIDPPRPVVPGCSVRFGADSDVGRNRVSQTIVAEIVAGIFPTESYDPMHKNILTSLPLRRRLDYHSSTPAG